jgi:hypothetical protein
MERLDPMSSNPWMVVPTLGTRDDTLIPLVRDAGMPTVIVDTTIDGALTRSGRYDRYLAPMGGGTIHGPTERNIHSWWNFGIRCAGLASMADVAVIVNDDVRAAPGALLELASHVTPNRCASAMLAWPDDIEHGRARVTQMTGYCFAIDPRRILPDEHFEWWYGDNDLELRARAMRPDTGVRAVSGLDIEHRRVGHAYPDAAFAVDKTCARDAQRFRARYPDLMGGLPAMGTPREKVGK